MQTLGPVDETVVAARLAALGAELAPLAACASKYVRFGVTESTATVMIAPMPWLAPQGYAFHLFEPLPFDTELGFACSDFYRAVLHRMNGCFAFGMSLYGLPTQNNLLTRATLRPLSLREANLTWRSEFEGAHAMFHFGSAEWSESESVGYFYSNGSFLCLRENGSACGQWSTFTELLEGELARVQALALATPAAAYAWHGA